MTPSGGDDQADPVAAAAGELYGLPLDEFTTARNDRAKLARAHGDKDAAVAIGKLAKPNATAWLANQLARQQAGQIRHLLELGDSMRRATTSLDAGQLRELSRQQRQVVAALVQSAHQLAAAAGQAVSDATTRGLEDTLHAALADDQAGQQLAQGRLTSGLARSGFPGVDMISASAWAPPARAPARPAWHTGPDGSAGRREKAGRAERAAQADQARRDEADARSGAARAGQVRDQAHAALRQAEQAAREAAATGARLRAELDAALKAQARADRARDQGRKDADRAATAARHAERRLSEAAARRKQLER